MKLTTPAFSDGALIPAKFTCDGANVSPPLHWSELPAGTKALALIVDDPDAPRGVFVHWLAYGIPNSMDGLPEGFGTAAKIPHGVKQGKNGFGSLGYGGPCPPSGTHRYFFHLYALDAEPDVTPGASREALERAINPHVIAKAELMGKYARAK